MSIPGALKNLVPARVRRWKRAADYLWHVRAELRVLLALVRLRSVLGAIASYDYFQRKADGCSEIHLKTLREPIRIRNGTSDFEVFRQVFLRAQYDTTKLPALEYAVDAGANIGLTSLYILLHNQNVHVIAIEPDPENYEIANYNLRHFMERCHLVHGALWAEERTLSISRGNFRDGRHWATQTVAAVDGGQETVKAYPLQSLLDNFSFPKIDLLKIDIEGAELNVFQEGETGFLDKTACCMIECHGPECQQAFTSAAQRHGLQISTHGELTVAMRA